MKMCVCVTIHSAQHLKHRLSICCRLVVVQVLLFPVVVLFFIDRGKPKKPKGISLVRSLCWLFFLRFTMRVQDERDDRQETKRNEKNPGGDVESIIHFLLFFSLSLSPHSLSSMWKRDKRKLACSLLPNLDVDSAGHLYLFSNKVNEDILLKK